MKEKFNPNDGELSRAIMEKDLQKYSATGNVPNKPTISMAQHVPVSKLANVNQVHNRNYSSHTGAELSHPLELMTLMANENNWFDWAVRVIGSACASTVPLFQIYSKADGRNNAKAAERKINQIKKKLIRPNNMQTGDELFLTTFENLAEYGNAYWQIVRTKSGEIHSIYTLPPETIRVIPYEDQYGILHCAYYQLDVVRPWSNNKTGVSNVYLEHEIIHFKETNEKSFLYGKPRGYSLMGHVTANAESLNAINNWFASAFSGGAIFKMESDESTAERNREFLKENYSGASNYGNAMLLEGGVELVDNGQKYVGNVKFEDMAAIGRDTILTCMGVPVSMAGVRSDAGMGNAEIVASEEKAFRRNTVDRLHKLVFSKIQQKLINEFLDEEDIIIEPGTLAKFSLTESIEAVRALSELGITVGESREILGMRKLELEAMNNLMVVKTNNGVIRIEDVLGMDPNTGERVKTILEKNMEFQMQQAEISNKINTEKKNTKNDIGAKAKELTGGASGLGGDLKSKVEGM